MFRRIEVIHEPDAKEWRQYQDFLTKYPDFNCDDDYPIPWKRGMGSCCYYYDEAVMELWFNKLRVPPKLPRRNFRFFFTEEGWKEIGSDCASMLRKTGTKFRVITIKENSVDVVYHDKYQVAARPRKRNPNRGTRN